MADNEGTSTERRSRATSSRSSARPARRTVEPVSDFDSSGSIGTVNSLDAANNASPLSKLRVRRTSTSLSRDIHVGQYLQVPSGHHTIFSVGERRRRNNAIAILVALAVVIGVAVFVVWRFMQGS